MKKWKCLTIFQPYAELIILGDKRVENREWPTRFRGPLLIHAGKSREWLDTWDDPMPEGMAFGAIVGCVRLVDCVHIDRVQTPQYPWLATHEHANGTWCWVLAEPRRCDPIPYRGRQGLFDVTDDVIAPARLSEREGGG